MSKRPSLFGSRKDSASEPAAPAAAEPATIAAQSSPKGTIAKSREGKRNVTAYLDPEAFTQLKIISAREDVAVQDLLIEGINEVFAKRGQSRIA